MKKFLLPAVVMSASIFTSSLLLPSGAWAQAKHAPKHSATKVETYMVIRVTDENKEENKVQYKAIATSQFKDEQKRSKDDWNKKMKIWHDTRKTDPTVPRPKPIKIEKVETDYETQEGAEKYADKLTKEAADKDTGDDKPKDNRR